MAVMKSLWLKQDKHIIFLISLTLICINSLPQAAALISDGDSRSPVSAQQLKSFSGGQVSETQRNIAHQNELSAHYLRAADDHERHTLPRKKRDLREIIAQQNLTFPPDIVERTKAALLGIQEVATQMKYFIENPPVNNETTTASETTAAEITGTTEPGYPTSAQNETEVETTIVSEEPVTATTPEITSQAAVTTTATTTPTTSVTTTTVTATTTTTPTTSVTTATSPGAITKSSTPSFKLVRMIGSKRLGSSGRSVISGNRIMTVITQREASELSDEKTKFSVDEIIVSLQIALNASEKVMMDKLSAETVIVLEESLASLRKIYKSIMPIVNSDEGKEKVLFWLTYLLMSVRHSLQRMTDEENASWLLSRADDITIVITTAFCILAIILVGGLFAYSFKTRKENRGNYKIDRSPQKSNLRTNPSRNPTSSSDAGDPNSFFSIPSGVTVQTRSNPMYSSHRSVDVERLPTVSALDKYRSDEPRSDDASRARGERNANGRDRRGVSPSADSSVTSFREPGRNKDRKYDAAKDNEGFLDDDAVGVRKDSESVL